MRYALLIYDRPGTYDQLPDDEREAVFGEYSAIGQASGVYGGAWLQPTETATTLRVEDGESITTDGPFAETKEFLGGLYLLEAEHEETALELAKRIPAARLGGAIEERPLPAPDDPHVAAPRCLGVAGLEPDRPGVAQPDQRVVAGQVELASLDRERQLDLAAPHDLPDPPLAHCQP